MSANALAPAESVASGLTAGEARTAMDRILSGGTDDGDIAEFLAVLAARGETEDELAGMLDSMMARCLGADLGRDDLIDVCGTGGDGARTFNVSTSAAFIAAAAGARVAKHGNRSSSGGTGSADMFEQLGADLDPEPGRISQMISSHGIAFMFAPRFHPAMRNAAKARRLISGTRTALNLLGPLANPASVRRQLVGVSSAAHLEMMPSILSRRGSEATVAVRSENGMDELCTASAGAAVIARGGRTERIRIRPSELGLAESGLGDLQVDGVREAFCTFVGAIDGTASRPVVETAALNAGAALLAAGIEETVGSGLAAALEAVRSGAASRLLDGFVAEYGRPSSLEEARKG